MPIATLCFPKFRISGGGVTVYYIYTVRRAPYNATSITIIYQKPFDQGNVEFYLLQTKTVFKWQDETGLQTGPSFKNSFKSLSKVG